MSTSTMIEEAQPAPPPPTIALVAAEVAHEANRAYCTWTGDAAQEPWAKAPAWHQSSLIKGVLFHMANPNAGPAASHEEWLREKLENGWTYGPTKDPELKQHPCMVPFDELPPEQQTKDRLFRAIIHAVTAKQSPEEARIAALEARLAEAQVLLKSSLGLFRTYQQHHLAKQNLEKATRNGDQANAIDRFLIGVAA